MNALIEHQDLSAFNTLAIQAEARFYWAIESQADLSAALTWYRQENPQMPLLVLGGGSNIILSDHFPGLVLHMQNKGIALLEEKSDDETVSIDVAAGENWHELVCYCCEQGWHGLENLALIPGAAGAAPIQNIGAYGVELCDVMDSLECLEVDSGKRYRLSAEQCQFAYRDSLFKKAGEPRRIISSIRLRLRREACLNTQYPGLQQSLHSLGVTPEQASPGDILQAVCNLRRAKLPDPAALPNVGSFFKNPIVSEGHYQQLKSEYADLVAYPHGEDYKLAAGWLIDQAGWKGHREARVAVHEQQALVLVNHKRGSAKDVLALAQKIRDDIWQRYQVSLEIEPRHIQVDGALAPS
ncbi:UDP-N-acetylmuramate dehydrogenase [Pseudoteredinibacter isoporae]|uniref:UDP-N-acetylmuramate dehydrogenase n=1 Tax=Pseudoteredinibacter isoporae TaxID=570281 RepID=UPI00310A5820